MMVSVVIPVKNREDTIGRALDSVFAQQGDFLLELIVVDDGSTDRTVQVVKDYSSGLKSLRLIKNETSVGGAVARNIGAKASKGQYIAFLDSDDEWRSNHLRDKMKRLNQHKARGCFGAFQVVLEDKMRAFDLPPFENRSVSDYIFVQRGDTRTSTFLFERAAFMAVQFDEKLSKHQDWDLAIRFAEQFKLVLDPLKNVNIHVNADNRMSYSNTFPASDYFLKKHKEKFSEQGLFNFKLHLCFNAFKFEGNSAAFKVRMEELEQLEKRCGIKPPLKYYLLHYHLSRFFLPVFITLHRKLRYGR